MLNLDKDQIENLKKLLHSKVEDNIQLAFAIMDSDKRLKARVLRKHAKFYNKCHNKKIKAWEINISLLTLILEKMKSQAYQKTLIKTRLMRFKTDDGIVNLNIIVACQ